MADANELVRAMKKVAKDEQEASKPVKVFFGEVLSVSPLKIKVEQKMVLGEAQLILARTVTDYEVSVTVRWETGSHAVAYTEVPHTHDIGGTKRLLVHNALEVGDKVILVRQQEGQKFVVVDRIGGRP